MANLIPPEAKAQIKVEYWTRVASVWLCLLGIAALVLVALNVPVYVLIQNQVQSYTSLYDVATSQQTSFEQVESQIVTANNTAVLLSSSRRIPALIPFSEELRTLADGSVTVNSYVLTRKDTAVESISVTGVAPTRESLVNFSEAIENSDMFASAEIPLSNLAKDRNIPFTLNVVVATEN